MAHSSFVSVVSRPLSPRETDLIQSLTSINPEWAGVEPTSLRVIAECQCGCQSVVLALPPEPQNCRGVGHQGPIGEISLSIRSERGDDLITVLLHQAEGSLSLLEVVWYNFPDPIPNEWIELSRDVAPR